MVGTASFLAVAVAATWDIASASPVLAKRAVSNARSSLTFLYQNNLNFTDDANHVGAILLDSMPYAQAAAACSSIGESLLPWETIQSHTYDFERQLAYQSYIGKSKQVQRYYIANNVVISATQPDGSIQIVSSPSRDISLPVLCTQSSTSNDLSAPATESNKITVASGSNTFVGYRNQKSFRFLGIPYVAQPERFTYSKYPSAPAGVVDATKYGMQCSQPYQAAGTTSENCLFLNIQTPYIPKAGAAKPSDLRPVHFWIHGGGFTGGNGADPGTDGGNLASREDIVGVTINYRLSTLGFLAIPGTDIKGNFAFGDMINALKWVKDNIAAFGGDPDRVVINGESAGAGSTRVLLGSPPAMPLFHGAISMSGLGLGYALGVGYSYGYTYADYLTVQGSYDIAGEGIFSELNCSPAGATLADKIACLKTADAVAMVNTGTVARYPVQDGYFINTERLDVMNNNGSTAHVDIMFGVSQDEGSSLITYPGSPVTSLSEGIQVSLGINAENAQKVIDSGLFPYYDTGDITWDSFNVSARIATDLQFRCATQAMTYAGAVSDAFKSAHAYQMRRTYQGYDPNGLGGPAVTLGYPYGNPNLPYFRVHSSEMPNCFGNLEPLRDANDLYTIQLSSGYWAEFIKTGTPNPPTRYLKNRGYDKTLEAVEKTGRWPEVRSKKGPLMLIDYPAQLSDYVDLEQCAWLGYPVDYYLQAIRRSSHLLRVNLPSTFFCCPKMPKFKKFASKAFGFTIDVLEALAEPPKQQQQQQQAGSQAQTQSQAAGRGLPATPAAEPKAPKIDVKIDPKEWVSHCTHEVGLCDACLTRIRTCIQYAVDSGVPGGFNFATGQLDRDVAACNNSCPHKLINDCCASCLLSSMNRQMNQFNNMASLLNTSVSGLTNAAAGVGNVGDPIGTLRQDIHNRAVQTQAERDLLAQRMANTPIPFGWGGAGLGGGGGGTWDRSAAAADQTYGDVYYTVSSPYGQNRW
ncbi:hypothetical protein H072_506 [Dactylellina haptotyla CBS 200.50]|uniref:Carboxylesterase type B domain-containing protein n=1 Tax=Dactylellina haptotyla (strain CBS 200.50) TaxID=1284197 RepID=S8ARA6_DACHA|nr:hypothetical protein H072_506 [Dactylellina haptotyla CBS 200.50]